MLSPSAEVAAPIGWLDNRQELVYQAAVLEGEAALDSWRRLMRQTSVDDLDPSCRAAFPMVFRNFLRQQIDVPERPILKRAYQAVWSRNQLLVRVGRDVIEGFDAAGIEHILLKGSALMFLDYEDVGVRPMADLDPLVRPEQVDDAVEVLHELGWRSHSARSAARIPLLWEDKLDREGGPGLDLHWRVMLTAEAEDDLWDRSVPLPFGSAESRSLSAPDRLMHVCVHGLSPSYPPAIRWVADATTIARRHEIDWSRIVDQAQRWRVSLVMGQGLDYLHRAFAVPVPPSVIRQLTHGPHSRLESAELDVTSRPMGLGDVVRWHWYRYRRVEPRLIRAVVGFPRYVRLLLGYDDRRTFARHVLGRLRRRETRAPAH